MTLATPVHLASTPYRHRTSPSEEESSLVGIEVLWSGIVSGLACTIKSFRSNAHPIPILAHSMSWA